MKNIIIALFLFSTPLVYANNENQYINDNVGIAFTKPDSWRFNMQENNPGRQKSVHITSNNSTNDKIVYSASTLVELKKEEVAATTNGVIPSLKIMIQPLSDGDSRKPLLLMNERLDKVERSLGKYELVQSPENTTITGNNASFAIISHLVDGIAGNNKVEKIQMWVIPRHGHFLIIEARTGKTASNDIVNEIQTMIQNLKLK